MILEDYRAKIREQLSSLYPPEEIASLANIVFEFVLKMNRVEVALSRKQILSKEQLNALDLVLDRLLASEPIQYITGNTQFYGLELQVNRATLIPRPETEELVEWILAEIANKQSNLSVLDIGTGSGCIAITIAKNALSSKVEAVDVSIQAIETASSNAQDNEVTVTFFQQDILEASSLPKEYDIIVSNPPYVRELEKAEIKDNVLKYEPHVALFVEDNDPLVFYRHIARLAVNNLTTGGQLFFEINEYLGKETVSLLKQLGFNDIELKKDMFGKDRMIRAAR